MRMELIRSRQASRSPDRRETAAEGEGTVEGGEESEGGGILVFWGLEIPRRIEWRLYPSTWSY